MCNNVCDDADYISNTKWFAVGANRWRSWGCGTLFKREAKIHIQNHSRSVSRLLDRTLLWVPLPAPHFARAIRLRLPQTAIYVANAATCNSVCNLLLLSQSASISVMSWVHRINKTAVAAFMALFSPIIHIIRFWYFTAAPCMAVTDASCTCSCTVHAGVCG